jgi:hypothetical protein
LAANFQAIFNYTENFLPHKKLITEDAKELDCLLQGFPIYRLPIQPICIF